MLPVLHFCMICYLILIEPFLSEYCMKPNVINVMKWKTSVLFW